MSLNLQLGLECFQFYNVLRKKKDGSVRFCIDFWELNSAFEGDTYPLFCIDEILDVLYEAKLSSTLSLASGYWQVDIHPEDREKTAT